MKERDLQRCVELRHSIGREEYKKMVEYWNSLWDEDFFRDSIKDVNRTRKQHNSKL